MIRKFTKFLFLFYVALLVHFQAGASGGLSDRLMPLQAIQLDIDTIVLDEPKVLIADPFNAIIELFIKTPVAIWGTSNYPDELIHFSVNSTYAWGAGDILSYDHLSKRYDCASINPYFFDDTLNHIHFHASYIQNSVTYDTIATFAIRYAKPVVTVTSVNDSMFENRTVVVNSAADVRFGINLNRAYQLIDLEGYDKVIALEARHDGGSWTSVLNPPGGVRDTNVNIGLGAITAGLTPGYNTIEFRAKGKCKDNCEEYSEVITIKIFYLSFENINSPLCKEDINIKLTGIPEGGYFEGDGVIDETPNYNPSIVTGDSDVITYNFLVEDSLYTLEQHVDLNEMPAFELVVENDNREVCMNEYDVSYSISGSLTDDLIEWNVFEGGELQQPAQNLEYATIHWHGVGSSGQRVHTGKFEVSVTRNNCMTKREFLVDIGNTVAPDKAFISLHNFNLLVCSDDTANAYYWYRNNSRIQIDGAPDALPYILLTDEYLPSPNGTTDYFVMTANEVNSDACFTESRHYIYNGENEDFKAIGNPRLKISPNPAHETVTLSLFPPQNGTYRCEIIDLTGKILIRKNISFNNNHFIGEIGLEKLLPGLYILKLTNESSSFNEKILVY